MNAIHATKKLNEQELELVIPPEASWHRDYDDTAFIYIGGLPLDLSEGDVITIFSQYGEPVFINLVRDKDTGKSKGFCFLKYEDQRSCSLAVDNLGGATVLGRVLRVDHTRYKKRDDEDIIDNTMGDRSDVHGNAETESEEEESGRPLLKEEQELAKMLQDEEDDDPMKAYMIEQKREEVARARAKLDKQERKARRHETHPSRDKDEYKKYRRERVEPNDSRKERRRRHGRDEDRQDQRRDARPDGAQGPDRRQDDYVDDRSVRRRHRPRSKSPVRKRERELSRTPVYDD